MTTNSPVTTPASRLRSARWLIAGGYASVVAGFTIGNALPPSHDELGIGGALSAFALGGLVGLILLLAGLVRGTQAVVRHRDQFRWFDYVILAGGLAPLVFIFVALLVRS